MKLPQIILVGVLLTPLPAAMAQDDAEVPEDDSVFATTQVRMAGAMTDSDAPLAAPELRALDAAGALAFGTVYTSGTKWSGTPNWSSSYNAAYTRYEITIDNEYYYYLNYTTILTPAGDVVFCRSSSVGGKLLVYCYDKNGSPATARFGFVTYKAP